SPAKTIPVIRNGWSWTLPATTMWMQFESPGVSLTRGVIWSNTGQAKIHQAANRRRVGHISRWRSNFRKRRDGNPQARLRANAGALPAHLDDAIVEHLRRPRLCR